METGRTEEMERQLPIQAALGQRGRRMSSSLPSGLNRLLQFAEFSWQNKPDTGSDEKDYFDQVAEAEAEKHLRHAHIDSPVEKSSYGRRMRPFGDSGPKIRKHSRYALGEGAYDPIRSDSEPEGESIDEMSEPESHSPLPLPKTRFKTNGQRRGQNGVTVDLPDADTDLEEGGDMKTEKTDRKSLAARRKQGVPPIDIINSNYKKSAALNLRGGSPSPSSSSIKSIIRDKFSTVSRSIPTVFMKRKADEYKLQAFVAILFLTIILLVGSIYVIHQEKELQKAYFNKIRFSAKDRKIRVSNLKGREVLQGILGNSLTKKDKAWPCLERDQIKDHSCLEWMNKARLYFSHEAKKDMAPSIECYGIYWQSLSPDFTPEDCYQIGEKKGFHFYGGGEMGSNQWPLNGTTFPMSPFITGNKHVPGQWGKTIRPYFVNSPGAIIQIAPDVPLHVSINDQLHPGMICFAAKVDDFAYPTSEVPTKLNYTVCTGENVRDVFSQLTDKRISDGLSQETVHLAYSLTKAPVWRILPETVNAGPSSEASLLNHTDEIAALHLSEGIILLDETWQKHMGDLEMDPDRFPTISETFNITRRRGFKVALTIQPFFSTESSNYLDGLANNLWVRERSATKSVAVPALTRYKTAATAVVLDVTKMNSRGWLWEKVNHLIQKYGVNALFVDFGSAQNFPEFYQMNISLASPDDYKDIFTTIVRQIGEVSTTGVRGARTTPKLPAFVSLSRVESSWEGLQSIIPNFLTMGVAGFPFIMPGSIGGDFKKDSRDFEANKPERNLYIRWLELVHFLPVIQYAYLPSDYDQSVIDIARNLNVIRNNKIYKYIRKAIDEALLKGLPIIRPLWMTDPNEPACLKISDEFTIGSDILVAPILTFNSTERNIYLPKGRWRDEMDGTTTKGDKWLNNYRVRDYQIAFFTKLAEGAM